MRIWSVDAPKQPMHVLRHGEGNVTGAFSRDGTLVVTTGADGRALLWSADGSEEPLLIGEYEKELVPAAFSPDGNRVITGSADGVATIITIGSDLLLESVHRRTRACLPADFRSRQLLEDPATAIRNFQTCEQAQRQAPR